MPGTEHLDQYAPSRALDRAQIPNLDLAPLFANDLATRDELEQQIHDACLNSGFFYVHNSCVDKGVIKNALAAAQAFFQAPDDGPVKQAVHNGLFGEKKGWGPMFGEPAYQPGTVARALGEVFSDMLGMERDFINRHSGEHAPRTMRLLHYPANDAPVNKRNVGIAAHTDFECFTIINQTASGLELTNADGEWCQAPSDIGTFTVVLGDMLERFSNGYLKATGHRVVNTPWQRFSMVLFFAVDGDFEVAPLEHFTSPDNPVRYAPVKQDEHIRIELERAAGNKLVG